MISSGYQIYNPPSKETFTFLKTGADTNGESLLMNVLIAPGGGAAGGPQQHKHPLAAETFTMKRNRLRLHFKDQPDRILEVGQTFTMPKDTYHTFEVADRSQEAEFTVEFQPALGYAEFFATLAATAQAHPEFYNADSSINMAKALPALSLFMQQFPKLTVLAQPPPALQGLLYAIFGMIGRLRGVKQIVPDESFATTAEAYARRKN